MTDAERKSAQRRKRAADPNQAEKTGAAKPTYVSTDKKKKMSEEMKRVLIIDALNAYLRAYIVDPSLSTNGQPIGGLKGFIKILQKLVRETKPDNIIIAWDGPDGSRKRKTMDKNYKAGRKPIRLNRAIRNLTEDEELANKMWQQKRIIEYMNEMPIIQVLIPQIEADDVISYVTQMKHYEGWQKIIVSNDKDFMQLCDENTILCRPAMKPWQILNTKRIIEEYKILQLRRRLLYTSPSPRD